MAAFPAITLATTPPTASLVSMQSVVFLNNEDCSSSIALFLPLALLLLLLPYVELEEAWGSFEKSDVPLDEVPLKEVCNEPVFKSCRHVRVEDDDKMSSCSAILLIILASSFVKQSSEE